MDAIYIISTGSLVAVTCGLLGCFLILRKMAMVGDAISHAVLPGIVIAFLLSGSRDSFVMLLGAGTIGIL
jgi:manganese/zinc/iron transport system permease protein